MNAKDAVSIIERVKTEVRKGLVGQTDLLDGLLTGIISNGHILIEGVPGLAKTRAVSLLARACQLSFKRLQFTPDLLPADIIGTRIYNQTSHQFDTEKGPVFAHFVLADEINRAPAKVQSALLEAMQEKQVTIGKETFPLPEPFFVFATQNPVEQEGTYPLPEAQLDRFLMKMIVSYPTPEEENDIVKMVMQETHPPEVSAVLDAGSILQLQQAAREVHVEDRIIDYIRNIVFATRTPAAYGLTLQEIIEIGASPRASISMAMAARAHALMSGSPHVTPDHVKAVVYPVLRHRILISYNGEAEGYNSGRIIEEILKTIKVP